MTTTCTCPQGHTWPATAGQPNQCPICGGAAVRPAARSRGRAWVPVVLAFVVAAVAVGGWSVYSNWHYVPDAPTLGTHEGMVRVVAFSPDGKQLASGGHDKLIKIWNVSDRTPAATLAGTEGYVLCLAYAPDGKTLASGGMDEVIRFWDPAGKETGRMTVDGKPLALVYTHDGKFLVGAVGSFVRVWDAETKKETRNIPLNAAVFGVAVSPDGSRIAVPSSNNTVRLFDFTTGAAAGTYTLGTYGDVNAAAFSPDSRELAWGMSMLSQTRVGELATMEVKQIFQDHSGNVWSVAFSPDGKLLAAGSADETVTLWDLASGQLKKTLRGHGSSVNSIAFSADGQWLGVGAGNIDAGGAATAGRVILWKVP